MRAPWRGDGSDSSGDAGPAQGGEKWWILSVLGECLKDRASGIHRRRRFRVVKEGLGGLAWTTEEGWHCCGDRWISAPAVSEQRAGAGRGEASLPGASALGRRSPPSLEGVGGVPIELILVIATY